MGSSQQDLHSIPDLGGSILVHILLNRSHLFLWEKLNGLHLQDCLGKKVSHPKMPDIARSAETMALPGLNRI